MKSTSQTPFDISNANFYELRRLFAKEDWCRDMDKIPPENIVRWTDLDYALDGTPSHTLDVYYPKGTSQALPTILNIHGGGWTYGTKGQYQYYCMYLAQQGFAVVNCNYRLAPENRYPAAVEDICTVIQWIIDHHSRFFFDLDHFFLVGDSAGAQIASQICVMVTNPAYQAEFDFSVPNIPIRAAAMNCGIYDMYDKMYNPDGTLTTRGMDYMPPEMPKRSQLDVFQALTDAYPPVYLMGSVNDPISVQGLAPFLEVLKRNKLSVVEAWYGQNNPELQHVFHINISHPEAQTCNLDEIAFFKKYCT